MDTREMGKPVKRVPQAVTILIASCWHDVNIGDIAHTPSLLTILQRHFPEVRVILWPTPTRKGPGRRELDPDVRRLLQKRFPSLRILPAGDAVVPLPAGRADLRAAFEEADLLIVNSGGFHAAPAAAFHAATGKPFVVFGASFSPPSPGVRELLQNALLLGCRDSGSMGHLARAFPGDGRVAFCPDAVFSFALRDDARAAEALAGLGIQDEGYLCVVPRLRHSPYHALYGYTPSDAEKSAEAENRIHQASDHALLRGLMVHWVRTTGRPVLACPEMAYGMALARQELWGPLPSDVRSRVFVYDRFWLPDEAASVFAGAAAVVSLDCHSPILALSAGTPAVYLRLPGDHPDKWRMFEDIGLAGWVHDAEAITAEGLVGSVMEFIRAPEEAAAACRKAIAFAQERQRDFLRSLHLALGERFLCSTGDQRGA